MMSTFEKLQHLKFGGILSSWKIKGFNTICCRHHIASLGHDELICLHIQCTNCFVNNSQTHLRNINWQFESLSHLIYLYVYQAFICSATGVINTSYQRPSSSHSNHDIKIMIICSLNHLAGKSTTSSFLLTIPNCSFPLLNAPPVQSSFTFSYLAKPQCFLKIAKQSANLN